MRNLNFKWKRWLLPLTSFFIITSLLLFACGPAEKKEAAKPTLKFANTEYETHWLMNALAKFILEEGYGYGVETVTVTVSVAMASLPKGDLDVWLDNWTSYWLDWYNEETAAGTIETLGLSMDSAPSFWIIPKWVHEEYGINTVFDMKQHWELFKDPADPTKGLFVNCPIGWNCQQINTIKLEAYGLTEYYNVVEPSAGALEAALAGAQKKHQPVFGYYWAPTALMGMYDWYILEEPAYDPDIWYKVQAAVEDKSLRPLDKASAYLDEKPANVIWSGVRDKAPEVIPVIANMNVGTEPTNKASAWVKENQVLDWEKAAIWYLREYESRWETWVTDDAYNKVKKALDEYGPIP